MRCNTLAAVSNAPRAATASTVAFTSLIRISAIGRLPSAGKISTSKLRHTLAAWPAVQPARWCSYHSSAKLLKVFCRAAIRSCLACFLASPGSCPVASRRRALSAASRASSREIRGYFPIDNSFSLPPTRYFKRYNLPPAGVICRYSPPPSASL